MIVAGSGLGFIGSGLGFVGANDRGGLSGLSLIVAAGSLLIVSGLCLIVAALLG